MSTLMYFPVKALLVPSLILSLSAPVKCTQHLNLLFLFLCVSLYFCYICMTQTLYIIRKMVKPYTLLCKLHFCSMSSLWNPHFLNISNLISFIFVMWRVPLYKYTAIHLVLHGWIFIFFQFFFYDKQWYPKYSFACSLVHLCQSFSRIHASLSPLYL